MPKPLFCMVHISKNVFTSPGGYWVKGYYIDFMWPSWDKTGSSKHTEVWETRSSVMTLAKSSVLTQPGRVAHVYVRKQSLVYVLLGANPLSEPILACFSIRPQGTYFNQISFENHFFSLKYMHLKMSLAKYRSEHNIRYFAGGIFNAYTRNAW